MGIPLYRGTSTAVKNSLLRDFLEPATHIVINGIKKSVIVYIHYSSRTTGHPLIIPIILVILEVRNRGILRKKARRRSKGT